MLCINYSLSAWFTLISLFFNLIFWLNLNYEKKGKKDWAKKRKILNHTTHAIYTSNFRTCISNIRKKNQTKLGFITKLCHHCCCSSFYLSFIFLYFIFYSIHSSLSFLIYVNLIFVCLLNTVLSQFYFIPAIYVEM